MVVLVPLNFSKCEILPDLRFLHELRVRLSLTLPRVEIHDTSNHIRPLICFRPVGVCYNNLQSVPEAGRLLTHQDLTSELRVRYARLSPAAAFDCEWRGAYEELLGLGPFEVPVG